MPVDEKYSVSERMHAFIIAVALLYKDYRVPLVPERIDSWSDEYAIVQGYYFEPRGFEPEGEFVEINYAKRDEKFRNLIFTVFGGPVYITDDAPNLPLPEGMLVVRLYEQSQEIEAYRHQVPAAV